MQSVTLKRAPPPPKKICFYLSTFKNSFPTKSGRRKENIWSAPFSFSTKNPPEPVFSIFIYRHVSDSVLLSAEHRHILPLTKKKNWSMSSWLSAPSRHTESRPSDGCMCHLTLTNNAGVWNVLISSWALSMHIYCHLNSSVYGLLTVGLLPFTRTFMLPESSIISLMLSIQALFNETGNWFITPLWRCGVSE